MPDVLLHAFGGALVAALLTNLTMPPVIRLAVSLRALDHPSSRKLQTGAVPRLGGVAILVGLLLGTAVGMIGHWGHWGQWDRLSTTAGRNEMLALAVGTALVFLVGLVDDLVGVSAARKFVFQGIAAWLLIQAGWSFEVLRLPFFGEIDLGLFGGVVSILWIVGVTNAINLIDGLDGLAGGVVAIIALSMLGYALLQGNTGTVILMAATAGACLGFLRHNWEPARIFMGDSGSLTLGYLLAAVSVHSALKAPAAVAILVPILALGVPVMDTVLVMVVRFLDRPKGALTSRFLGMFHADRQHLHHLLSHLGGKRSRIVAIIYSVVLSFCGLALVVAVTGQDTLGVMLVALEFSVILFMRQLGLSMEARRIARQQKEEMKVDLGLAQPQRPGKVRNIRRMAG